MKRIKSTQLYLLLIAILGVFAIIGCAVPDADTTAPTVESTDPADAATGVLIDAVVTATFDEAMDADTIAADNFTLAAGATDVPGAVSYDVNSKTATFTPTDSLANDTEYTATIGVGVLDLAGNALAGAHVWSFTTGSAAADTTPPTLIATVPLADAIDVVVSDDITATFSEAMDEATIIVANFTVEDDLAVAVAGVVTYDAPSKTATFNPDSNLGPGVVYTATITTGVTDSAGNALLANEAWSFTTAGLGAALGPATVNLLTAGNYAILAQTQITNVATSAITGDVGLSPAAESLLGITPRTDVESPPGFIIYATNPQVVGYMYAADMTGGTVTADLTQAISDKDTAYTDAAGRIDDGVGGYEYFLNLDDGLLDETTVALVPGLYDWGTTVSVTNQITISGDANDVWIFQVTGDLTVANGANVILVGGALPENIFWQVTGIAQLGTGAHFEGIILGFTQIQLLTGATMNGRVLATTQVVLQMATITQPAP